MRTLIALVGLHLAVAGAACRAATAPPDPVGRAAEEYVRLVASLGRHDPDSAESDRAVGDLSGAADMALNAIPQAAAAAIARIDALPPGIDDGEGFRRRHLVEHLDAVALRAREVGGGTLTLEEQHRLLGSWGSGAVPPGEDATEREVRGRLDRLLPGAGPLSQRVDAFDRGFTVSPDRLPLVFERAMRECRSRTTAHVRLPPGEAVTIRYVTNRPWSGYSRYQGEGRSRIEVNTSLPLTVDRILELACHEGYPGHHVQNALRDDRLVRSRHWQEFSVMPVFSPESFAAEAAASLATRVLFTDEERLAFERDVLCPLAGLPPAAAGDYLRVARLREQLEPAMASVVSGYLTGRLDVIEAGWALEARALMSHPAATLQFVNRYRWHSLAYTQGKTGVEGALHQADQPAERRRRLLRLIEIGMAAPATRETGEAG